MRDLPTGSGYKQCPECRFVPEKYSGLNADKAKHLIGKTVEFSDKGDIWTSGTLIGIDDKSVFKFSASLRKECDKSFWYIYVRTTPETFKPKTIKIKEAELPFPETEPLKFGKEYFIFCPSRTEKKTWSNHRLDTAWLKAGRIHKTEKNCQAWVDWWNGLFREEVK